MDVTFMPLPSFATTGSTETASSNSPRPIQIVGRTVEIDQAQIFDALLARYSPRISGLGAINFNLHMRCHLQSDGESATLASRTWNESTILQSYNMFRHRKEASNAQEQTKFMISFTVLDSLHAPGESSITNAIHQIQHQIPHSDLAIQLDLHSNYTEGASQHETAEHPSQTAVRLRRILQHIPLDIDTGLHVCCRGSTIGPEVAPARLTLSVDTAVLSIIQSPRAIKWIHIALPQGLRHSSDFTPLQRLPFDTIEVFLGVVCGDRTVDGASQTIRTAAGALGDIPFGIGDECGLADITMDELNNVFQLASPR